MAQDIFTQLSKGISSTTDLATQNPFSQTGFRIGDKEDLQAWVQNLVKERQQAPSAEALSFNTAVVPDRIAKGANIYGVNRQPWVFACFDDLTSTDLAVEGGANVPFQNGIPPGAIVWSANPKSVDWQINQRGTESKTKAGSVLSIWRDRFRKTDMDDPKITITFQSGNIMPVNAQSGNPNLTGSALRPNQISPGLENFYGFLKLVDQPKISKNSGQANLVHILYRSSIFPSIILTGFFDPQMTVRFTDTADQPFQITGWSAGFTIYRTIPQLSNMNELMTRFQNEFFPTNTIDNRTLVTPGTAIG